MKKFLTLVGCTMLLQSYGQRPSDDWDLRHCIEHAIQFNISIQQADVQARIAALQAKQAKYNSYPNVNGNSSTGVRFGRSIDPTTNTFSTQQFLYQNFGINAGFQLYNQGRLKYVKQAAEFNAQAALADVERAKNDIAFNVATYYLQVLSAKEQIKISEVQLALTQNQVDITRKRVDAGALPELNYAEMEAQLALDSSNYYTAKGNYQQSLLALRALLNLDTEVLFGIATPPVDQIPLEPLSELQPDAVYQSALTLQPAQKVNELRIKAAQKDVRAAKALMYPTVTVGGNLSTNFSNSFKRISGATFLGYTPITGAENIVNISNVTYYIQSPVYKVTQSSRDFGSLWDGWSNQLSNNFGQNVGLSISVPIFNNFQARTGYRQSQLNLKYSELTKKQGDQTLRQNVYTAYANALTALQKFNAGAKTVESAQKAYDYASKRYEVGMLSSLDLLTNQNNLLRAKLQQLTNQYDYVFKMKLLEFYKGKGLKL
ncbi:TolC family protein [Sediminibacterium soli]|uniref:TolC family protein n=1 Tax=Sediminibacterium soli TaxID=2698829 RepID=UPI001379B871|nr:TolC family protein [Sediminibacterium soli]NCI45420.1 TolC family protein [Sediminibacterium soli]